MFKKIFKNKKNKEKDVIVVTLIQKIINKNKIIL